MFATFRAAGDPLRYEMPKDPEERAAVEAFEAATMVYIKRYERSLLTAVPGARIVELAGANYYILISNEADVLPEIRAFVTRLPSNSIR